jgi:4-amino-4-deoxychorismate lyase
MDSIVIINGKEQSNISIFNRNFQYGDGLFETCVVNNNQILFWEKHLSRLDIGCRKLKIKNIEEEIWLKDIKKALSLTSKKKCVLKLILSRGNSQRGYSYSDDILPVRVVVVSEVKNVQAKESFSLEYASSGYHSNPNLAGIKHCNRIEQILARSSLKRDEAIMLDENQNIISVTQGNIYFIFGQSLVTPKLDRCGVIGSRRSLILELAESIELNVEEGNVSMNDAKKADEAFISNSIMGIQSVNSIEEYQLTKRLVTKQIKIAFELATQDIKSWTCI